MIGLFTVTCTIETIETPMEQMIHYSSIDRMWEKHFMYPAIPTNGPPVPVVTMYGLNVVVPWSYRTSSKALSAWCYRSSLTTINLHHQPGKSIQEWSKKANVPSWHMGSGTFDYWPPVLSSSFSLLNPTHLICFDMIWTKKVEWNLFRNMTWSGAQGLSQPITIPFQVEGQGVLGNFVSLNVWFFVLELIHGSLADDFNISITSFFSKKKKRTERGFTFVEVDKSGHMIPKDQPQAGLQLFEYLIGQRDSPWTLLYSSIFSPY